MERVCKKCGSNAIELKESPNCIHRGIYCKNCGSWIMWIKKDAENRDPDLRQQLKNSNNYNETVHNAVKAMQNTDDNDFGMYAPHNNYFEGSSNNVTYMLKEEHNALHKGIDLPFDEDVMPNEITFLSHGFSEIVLANGTRQGIPDNSRVHIKNGIVNVYHIVTEELISTFKLN